MSPGTLDRGLVQRHLMALDTAVRQLRRHAGKPLAALKGDLDEIWAIERGLQICAQNCLDIATHLAASAGEDVPDYASAIDKVAQLGVLPQDFASRFRGVAGFRNVIVHGYLDVDLATMHQVLNNSLDDFVAFAGYVERHLGNA